MIILKPISKERIWGTEKLHAYSGDETIQKIGSVYTASANPDLSNEIETRDFTEKDLYTAVKNHPRRFGLEEGEPYPIIVSMTGANENLSIQVHPTDDFARRHEQAIAGKSESWYFIDPPTDGWIYANSRLSDKAVILEKMKEGKFEEVVGRLDIQKGDLAYIESGTLHALTKGSLVYEIQQATDITYRFYDYDRSDKDGRKRELHLEKAVDTLQPENRVKKGRLELDGKSTEKPYDIVRTLLKDPYQNTEKIAQVVTVIQGILKVNEQVVHPGTSFLILPEEAVRIQESAEVIIATPKRYYLS